jgi:hypothetical protein
MKFITGFFVSLLTLTVAGQSPKRAIKKLGNNPIFFVDSVCVDKSELSNYQPTDIAAVSVYKDSSAINLVGPEGKDGVVYIETKVFAKKRYWTYFTSKSAAYASLVPTPESDSVVQYILNKRVLTINFEGDLALINDSLFKALTILDPETLQMKYGISGKTIGVWIEAAKPADLYRAKNKF